jgi:phosphatidylserine synthase
METEEPKTVHRGIKKGLYVIPTAFTAANVAMGFLAVLYSIRGFRSSATDPAAASGIF